MVVHTERQFSSVDYGVFVVNLGLCGAVGLYHVARGRKLNARQLFMGDRDFKVLPLTVSLVVSVISAVTLIGLPAEMYTHGSQYFFNIGSGLGILLTTFIFVPLLHPLKLTSMFEYLERRFASKAVRLTGSILEVLALLLYGGTALFAPTTAIHSVTGLPNWVLVLALGGMVTFYTSLGGMRAVIWTDVLQAAIMILGIVTVFTQGVIQVGGFAKVYELNKQGGRLQFYNFDPNPTTRHTFWGLSVGFSLGSLSFYGASQFTFQRFAATKSLRDAKKTVLLNLPLFYLFHISLCATGMVIFAFYAKVKCDPLANKDIRHANQLLPLFVMDTLGSLPGMPGLFVASLTSGALSTISSVMNSVSTLVWEDLLLVRLSYLSDAKAAWLTRTIVFLSGAAIAGLAFMADNFGPHIFQVCFAFLGASGGPQLGLFLLGAFIPWANGKGAICGCVAGLMMTVWITMGSYLTKPFTPLLPPTSVDGCHSNYFNQSTWNTSSPIVLSVTALVTTQSSPSSSQVYRSGLSVLYSVSYAWYTAIGVAVCLLVGLLVSFLTGSCTRHQEVQSEYVLPCYQNISSCLKSLLRCRGRDSTSEAQLHMETSVAETKADIKTIHPPEMAKMLKDESQV